MSDLNQEIKILSNIKMSPTQEKKKLIESIRNELYKKKQTNSITNATFTNKMMKLYVLENTKNKKVKSIENFYEKEIKPLTKELNTQAKVETKKKEEKKKEDIIIQQFNKNLSSLSKQLSTEMWTINTPKNYSHCLSALNSCPIMKSSTESKVKTYYFYNIQSLTDILGKVTGIYANQKKMFKMSMSLGFIYELQGTDNEGKYIYTYSCARPSNSKLLLTAELVKNKEQLKTNVYNKLTEENIKTYLTNSAPTSAHKIIGVNACMIRVYGMEHNIGAKVKLPEKLESSRSIINPESSNNLCFWNCIAYHQIKNKRCATLGKELYKAFYGEYPLTYIGFDYINELEAYEQFSKYNINVFEYEEETQSLKYIRKSEGEENVINLLIYLNHFVYVKNVEIFNGCKYMCTNCGITCEDITHLNTHSLVCDAFEQKDVFCKYPQVYEPERNLIIRMNEIFDCECDYRYKPIVVYDFESLILKCVKKHNPLETNMKIPTYQQAVSVSLYTNVLGFDKEIFIENEKPEILFYEMFKYLDSICAGAIQQMKTQMSELYVKIESLTNEDRKKRYLEDLNRYVEEVPIIGFNSGKYDINLNIKEFMTELNQRNGNKIFSVKNGVSFKTLKSGNFAFMDICQYLPPNYNLDQYIKAFNKDGLKKSVFPYEYMDSYEKLSSDINLIERKHFFSSLKNCGITDEEWAEFNNNKFKHQWKTLRDLLKFYNNLDVKPFLEAVINNQNYYYRMNLEMFKDGLSLPALSEKILFSFRFREFNNEFVHQQIPETKYELLTNWRDKFKGYIEQDRESERYNKDLFVNYMELNGLMNKQSCKCLYCWETLNNNTWSLDRIDNDYGHNVDNCVLSCIKCNVQRKDEYFKVFYRKKALMRYSKIKPCVYLIDEENKDVFYLLKNNVLGGPSIVYHRYHEADKTKIKRPVYENGDWIEGKEGKTVKNITGFDANALYLKCIGEEMPCGVLKYKEFEEYKTTTYIKCPFEEKETAKEFGCRWNESKKKWYMTNQTDPEVKNYFQHYDETVKTDMNNFINTTDGFFLVDIFTKEEDYNKFGEFPLVFKNAEYDVNLEAGDYMKEVFSRFDSKEKRMTRKLISSYKGEKVLIKSTRLRWMIEKGLVVSKIHGYIKCTFANIFKEFVDWVSDERRKGDVDEDYEIMASMAKNIGNSAFGRTGMNKNKFNKTKYGDELLYNKKVACTLFQDANQYGEVFEVTSKTRITRQNMPIQIASSIYDDAKLKMSEFYYDCVDKYISRQDFQYCEMDTDSAYMALTDDFFKLIKPEMKEEFEKDKNRWFPRTDTKEHIAYDKRTAGLFKEEFIGKGIVCISSKLYYVKGFEKKDKLSAKGIQQKHNVDIMNFETYKDVVLRKQFFMAEAKGMRIFNDKQINKEENDVNQNRKIYNYETVKIGLTEKYDKRIVLSDGVSTVPLKI